MPIRAEGVVPRAWVAYSTMRGWPRDAMPSASMGGAPGVLERSAFLKHALGPEREGHFRQRLVWSSGRAAEAPVKGRDGWESGRLKPNLPCYHCPGVAVLAAWDARGRTKMDATREERVPSAASAEQRGTAANRGRYGRRGKIEQAPKAMLRAAHCAAGDNGPSSANGPTLLVCLSHPTAPWGFRRALVVLAICLTHPGDGIGDGPSRLQPHRRRHLHPQTRPGYI